MIDSMNRTHDVLEREIAQLCDQLKASHELNGQLARTNGRLVELSMTDDLTGLKNRRHFRESLTSAYSFAVRHGKPLSLIMLDVDEFKRFNDAFGHQSGDVVLSTVAGKLRSVVRDHDLIARYGGEEFV